MDALSTAYDFTMRDGIADVDDMDNVAALPPAHRATPTGVETLLDGLDAVTAVYDLVRR